MIDTTGTPILAAPAAEGAKDQHMIINLGPQHPATHGVLRLVLEIDGEIIVRIYPEIGYLHTGIEKTCEAKFYQQVVPLTDRVDYLNPMANNLCYCLAVEKLLGLEIPDKAQWLRVLLAELTLTIASEEIRSAAAAVQAAGYNFFEDMTAVDWFPSSPRFQLSYHILSHSYRERIRLRVLVEGGDPAVESITSVWPSSNFYEREVFDLFGIRFEGHPNLRRILMPDDWQGHPLRKDYPVEGYR